MSHAWILERRKVGTYNLWKPVRLCKTLREGEITKRIHNMLNDDYAYQLHKYVRK